MCASVSSFVLFKKRRRKVSLNALEFRELQFRLLLVEEKKQRPEF